MYDIQEKLRVLHILFLLSCEEYHMQLQAYGDT